MTREQKDRMRGFIAALRSGNYKQGQGALTRIFHGPDGTQESHCCLGVACVHAMNNTTDVVSRAPAHLDRNRYQYFTPGAERIGSTSFLPHAVAAWYGINTDPEVKIPRPLWRVGRRHVVDRYDSGEDPTVRAVTLNDDYAFTFDQIADCFEYTYLRKDWEARNAA